MHPFTRVILADVVGQRSTFKHAGLAGMRAWHASMAPGCSVMLTYGKQHSATTRSFCGWPEPCMARRRAADEALCGANAEATRKAVGHHTSAWKPREMPCGGGA